jgi:HNH endonuclease
MVLIGSEIAAEQHKRTRSRKLKWIRALYIRDGRLCVYCGREMMTLPGVEAWEHEPGIRLPGDFPTLDHIVPKSQGGRTVLDNLVIACATCNGKKGNQATYVSKQQFKKFSTVLGTCPECKEMAGRVMCRICRGAGLLDENRYHEVIDMLHREANAAKKKAQQARHQVRKLEEIVREYEGVTPGHIKDRVHLLRAIENLKTTVKSQAERIKELGGGRQS